jgi:hypothetical protein
MVMPAGDTAIDERAGDPTDNEADPETAPETALMVVAPSLMLFAKPPAPIAATPAGVADQLTDEVRFCVLPSV